MDSQVRAKPPFKQVHVIPFEKIEIVLAELGTHAGMIDAAVWAKQQLAVEGSRPR